LGLYQSGEELPESERPSVSDVAEDGRLAIIAGSDTTSSALAALLYYLLLNPETYKHLEEEVDSAFTSGEEPLDAVKLSQMEWLNGCMWVVMQGGNISINSFFPLLQQ
jgi:cytochrome P450